MHKTHVLLVSNRSFKVTEVTVKVFKYGDHVSKLVLHQFLIWHLISREELCFSYFIIRQSGSSNYIHLAYQFNKKLNFRWSNIEYGI